MRMTPTEFTTKQKLSARLRLILDEGRSVFLKATQTSLELYKIMIPILVLTRLLEEVGVVAWLGNLLEPLMEVVGLPGSMGLVWATSLVVGTYGALLVFVTFLASTPLTVAQATILLTMCLIAHSLPVEVMIAHRAGLRASFQILLRVGASLLYGWSFHHLYRLFNFLQTPIQVWMPISTPDPSMMGWLIGQIQNLFSIFLIILGILALLRLLEILGIVTYLTRILGPVLRLIGIGDRAVPITMVGILLGLAFGGGLIIQEAKSGHIPPREMFFSLALMSIFHSLIEDTLTMVLFGAHLSGLLWGRLVFTFLVIWALVKLTPHLSEVVFERYFFTAGRQIIQES